MAVRRTERAPRVERKQASWWARNQKKITPYIFIAPNMIVFTVFLFVPMAIAVYMSFNEWSLIEEPTFIGFGNYVTMFRDPQFWQSLGNTLLYTAGTVPLNICLGLLVAVGMNRALPARGLLRSIFFVPVVISGVAVALVGSWIFNDAYGVINNGLGALGFEAVPWLTSQSWAMLSIIAMALWLGIGFNMVVYLAALQGIPPELYEAAEIDGASGWRRFRSITWPLLGPTTFLLVILGVIQSLHVFDLIFVMTGGGPGFATTVLVMYVYQTAFQNLQMGYASAMGVVLFLMLLAFTAFQWWITRQGEQE
ncbi:MAG: carbohydrate ABC transporter permease [Rubrobacteraceae bacterium]